MSTAIAATDTQQKSAVDNDPAGSEGAALAQVVSFRLANEQYGLDIMSVQEIILMGSITEIPEVPEYIRGLINLRGKVIPIVDLRKRFRLQASPPNEHTRIIVVIAGGQIFGVVVDAVNEVLRLDAQEIEPAPKGITGLDSAYIKGLVKMPDKIMILLEMDRIMSHDDQVAVAKSETAAD